MTSGRRLAELILVTSIVVGLPTAASSQALLADQKDMMAHLANVAIAAEECAMSVDHELLDATMAEVGLARAEIETEPYRSALAEAAQEAQISLEASGLEVVCERLDAMYGPTGLRLPGVLAR